MSTDDIGSSNFLGKNDYGPKNNRGHRYVLVVIDNFSKIGWITPLKHKYAQSIADAFSQIVKTSKRQTKLFETDVGTEYVTNGLNVFLRSNNIKKNSRNTALGTVFAERFNKTMRNLLKKPIFEKGRLDILINILY